MSKFFKALEQAKHDRALRTETLPEPTRSLKAAESPRTEAPARPWPLVDAGEGIDEHLVSLIAPAAFEAEQYRALRHIVEQMHRTADLKVLAVSSPGMGDGKTITSINLAGALAQATEARVLLIGADLRRPALGHLLDLAPTDGADFVGAILDPSLTLDLIARPRPPFNLSVICAGHTPPSPYEVLKSPRVGELMEEARRQFDFVIVDTPPLAPVQDCRVIGRWVDGFLLVVAAHRTTRRLLEAALTTVDPSKVLGIVFNEDDQPTSRLYSGYYDNHDSSSPPLRDTGPAGPLSRAVTKVGDSFRRRSATSATGRVQGRR